MKKLMIAAAAAAMIGGVEAADTYAYDLTASLKTTVGAKTKGTKVTFGIGKDTSDNWWYEDTGITYDPDQSAMDADATLNVTTGTIANVSGVYVIRKVTKRDATSATLGKGYTAYYNADGKFIIDTDAQMKKNALSGVDAETRKAFAEEYKNYNVKSAGQWCAAGSYQIATCYRKAGSKKITKTFESQIGTCCDASSINDAGFILQTTDTRYVLTPVLFHRFGSDSGAKATKVEYMAYLGTISDYGKVGVFAFAGQGSWNANLAGKGKAGVNSISGNVVGAYEVTCENCCEDPSAALAFYCDGATEIDDATCSGGESEHTAAYGSFTLKFNKKASTIQ